MRQSLRRLWIHLDPDGLMSSRRKPTDTVGSPANDRRLRRETSHPR